MKRIAVRMPDSLHESLRRLAFQTRTSINELVLIAIRSSLGKKGQRGHLGLGNLTRFCLIWAGVFGWTIAVRFGAF